MRFIKNFADITTKDHALVGGKNYSLGLMIRDLTQRGITVPHGFAITVDAYWYFLEHNNLQEPIKQALANLTDYRNTAFVHEVASKIRALILASRLPDDLAEEIITAYKELSKQYNQEELDVAIRSSATAEDLPNASFAGQLDSFLNIKGSRQILEAVKMCIASLFTDRAVVYRGEKNFDHLTIGISVGIQKMVRSDLASAGVIFSLDTETGFKEVIVITSSYGLGENIVKGIVNPDEFHVYKPTLAQGYRPIIKKYLGSKHTKLICAPEHANLVKNVPVSQENQTVFSITDNEILELAKFAQIIENYYTKAADAWSPMDIEWAKDGIDQKLYIVQARPETVHSHKEKTDQLVRYNLATDVAPQVILTGQSIGQKIAHGTVQVLNSLQEINSFREGDILVTSMTDPDWVPLMKKAAGIITDKGGRTCHAAIVSRELGIPAIIGTTHATTLLQTAQAVTMDCSKGATGYIYEGLIPYRVEKTALNSLAKPPVPLMLNIANPDRAYELSFLPVAGVGLARVEFIINNAITVHPMAIIMPDQIKDPKLKAHINALAHPYGSWKDFYIDTLAQGIATIAAAFYPSTVIVRLSDFKSNEYRNLLGGDLFEPIEENPMIGFRGAIRYCDKRFSGAFALECAAFNKVRKEMGLFNIKLMVPFVRTLEEARCTLDALAEHNIRRGEEGLEIIMMCEIPSNVLLIKKFAEYFDGFSIGSNDLTQLTLGVDRDSALLHSLFDERDEAAQEMFKLAIKSAKEVGTQIGICGQAPSDFPEIADLLIQEGIDYLSLNSDSVIPFLSRYAAGQNKK